MITADITVSPLLCDSPLIIASFFDDLSNTTTSGLHLTGQHFKRSLRLRLNSPEVPERRN